MRAFWYIAPVFILILGACDESRVYDKYEHIKKNHWTYEDVKSFEVEIFDSTQSYNVILNLRHAYHYQYENIWVKVRTEFPSGKKLEKRINLKLTEKNGNPYGKCIGDICDIQIPIQENAIFPEVGKYTFELEQSMRQNPLPFVMSVGIRIEKATDEK